MRLYFLGSIHFYYTYTVLYCYGISFVPLSVDVAVVVYRC